jgi:hypothetical protein
MIDLQATHFQRGDAVALPSYGEPLGISGKWAEYDFSIAEEGNYVLSVRYATGEIRAVSVFLDGNLITDDGMANTTGGYESAKGVWEEVAILRFTAGEHTLRIQRDPCLPHISVFRLMQTTEVVSEVPALRKKKEQLRRLLQDIKITIQSSKSTDEIDKLSGISAVLEKDLAGIDIRLPGSTTLKILDAIEQRTADLRVVLAGLMTERLTGSKNRVALWASNPLIKIFKDSLLPEKVNTEGVCIEALRNEYEPAQVCISSYDFQGAVRIKVNPLIHLSGKYKIADVKTRFVGYVPIPKNTPGRNDFLRTAPALFPDPLVLDEEVVLEPRQTQPVWITVKVPRDALPGEYRGEIEAITATGKAVLPLNLVVYPVTLPEATNFWMGAWGGDTKLAEEFGIIARGEWEKGNCPQEYFEFLEHEAVMNRYEHRARVFSDQPLWVFMNCTTKIFWKDGGYVYDYTVFDTFVSTIEKGFHSQFRITCLGIADGVTEDGKGLRTSKITVLNPDGSVNPERSFSNIPTDDRRYLEFIGHFFKAISLHLQEKGWLDKVYFKVIDEPIGGHVAPFLRLNRYIKQTVPEIRLDATFYDPAMVKEGKSVDLAIANEWMVNSGVHPVEEEIKNGYEYWLYNDFKTMIDLPLIHTREMGWIGYRYGFKGYMHWAWCWKDNPWENTFDETAGGAGAHFLVYPDRARKKIVDSIRWEMFREAAEDYDTLCLLKESGGDSQKFCQQLVKGLSDCEDDPERFYQLRHQVLLDLNRLSQ